MYSGMKAVCLPKIKHNIFSKKGPYQHLLKSVNPQILISQKRGQVSEIKAVENESLEINVENTSQKNTEQEQKFLNRSRGQRKRWSDPSEREHVRQVMKEKWKDPVFRQKVITRVTSEDVVQKKAATMKLKNSDPVFRQKMQNALHSQEARQKRSKTMRKLWREKILTKPRNYQSQSEYMRNMWADPIQREKMLAIRKAARMKRKQELSETDSKVKKVESTNTVGKEKE
eukprot:TRINITY_DN5290_c0_g1_i4.p1 TRINITY_DN5290_c0_g1~~TRINITY_DN5290_c0_g1_i4.p1  ORF type:complete len:229 (-),score=13.40 TRINITY_DN5290_c0_g1_i4:779-1465(-)